MFEKIKLTENNVYLHSLMLEDHENVNRLMNSFINESKKINGNTSEVKVNLGKAIAQFENKYNVSYCYDFNLMVRKKILTDSISTDSLI